MNTYIFSVIISELPNFCEETKELWIEKVCKYLRSTLYVLYVYGSLFDCIFKKIITLPFFFCQRFNETTMYVNYKLNSNRKLLLYINSLNMKTEWKIK